jgi:uncharacterized protein YdhG (YjbR/CyaY superfamily)
MEPTGEAKTAPQTIDEYMTGYPGEVQEILQQVREVIRSAAPEAQETINYGIPTFTYKGRNLVHFGAAKKHIGFYPTPSGIEKFKNELAEYQSSKGSVQFPLDQPIPYDLIRTITAFRVQEVNEKTAAKPARKKKDNS